MQKRLMLRTILSGIPVIVASLTLECLAGQSANWRKSVKIPVRSNGEPMVSLHTRSTNTVKSFSRTGRGTLIVTSYEDLVGIAVNTFVRITASDLRNVESWCDDDKPSTIGVWSGSENGGAVISLLTSELDTVNRILKAKTFNIRYAAIDGERHVLTFNVQGLGSHLNLRK